MENRKFVKFLIPIFILGLFLFGANSVFAYGIDTHAFLTKDAVEFYSEKVATSSASELVDYLVDGARSEDDIPRWMNHFYDPVFERGLTEDPKIDPFYVLGSWNKSKDWASNSDLQNEMKYKVPTTIASILDAIQQRKISSLTTETDFTWNEALYFWINGEKEKSMFALGHVLHLIQDVSVPDHTRNDPHPEGSIYEKWAGKFTLSNPDKKLLLKLANKNLINLDNLSSYFNELAKYSNNNFYSKDTIGIQSGYDLPEPDFNNYNIKLGLYYVINRDFNNEEYFLIAKKSLGNIMISTKTNTILDDEVIKQSYWDIISPKAVQYSASVLDLFFKEVERLKDDPQFAKKESFFAQVIDAAKNIVSAITGTAENIISVVKDNAQIQDPNLLASISLEDSVDSSGQAVVQDGPINELIKEDNLILKNENIAKEPKEEILVEELIKEEEIIPEEDPQKLDQEISTSTQDEILKKIPETKTVQEQVIRSCSFQTSKSPIYQNLLINEVAWMGSIKSSSDEWTELKNISNSELDISNWQILDKEEQIKIIFPVNAKISAGGFLLLERTDDNSVPNVKADITYVGALSNSNEGLRLFDGECNLIDEVLASNDWSAGDPSTKRTMERQLDLSWSTYIGSGEGIGEALILGTPKKENSIKTVSYSGGGAVVVVTENNNDSNTQQDKILISEVQITGGTGKTNNDLVEIYNPNDSRVNLKGYRLVKRTKTGTSDVSIKSWTDDVYIEAKSFYLWASSEFIDISVVPDITTSGTLASDNGVALRFGAIDTGTIIDSVAWGAAENIFIGNGIFPQNPGAGQSIQRKIQNNLYIDTDNGSSDFELTTCPNPKAQSRFCEVSETSESNQAPSAFFVLSTTTPKIAEEIIFDASSSVDLDGNISLYDWNFGDGSLATSTQATTTHSYLLAGNYNISLIVYDDLGATSTNSLALSVASSIIQKNESQQNVLIAEIMAGLDNGRSDEEFIELYNPTSKDIDLSGYSLRRRSSISATTTQNLVRNEDFASTTIKANGFLLISSREYRSSSTPDIYYSNSSYHLAYDDDAIILYDSLDQIIDEVDYESIDEGKSLERKAFINNICVSAEGSEGEFFGNGCDTNELANFEINNLPSPQNINSYSEPRVKPASVTNFIGQYDKANKKINLNWDQSSDYISATSTLSYLISDISLNPLLNNIETASTTAEFDISETDRDYTFEIRAIDKDGLNSESSSVTVFVSSISIEDVDYYILDQKEILSSAEGVFGRVFKPLAEGVLGSVTLNLFNVINNGDVQGSANTSIEVYEWVGESSTTSPNIGRGQLVAKSLPRELHAFLSGNYVWNFDSDNQVVLDANKYYYLQVNTVLTRGNLSIFWGLSSASGASDKVLYAVIKAVENGTIVIENPINNNIYQDINTNFIVKYSEPFENKYGNLSIDVKDFYTGGLVSSQTMVLNDSEKIIGWHEVVGNLNMDRPGYFKLIISLSDTVRSEINFSIFSAVPAEGKLLDQTAFMNNLSASSVAQSFKPMINGQLDSIALKLSTGGNGWNYTSLKIYEWIGGQSNSLEGSKGQLLATSESKMIWNNSLPGEGGDLVWDFSDENEIDLITDKYYYLESVVDSQSNGGAPGFIFRGSDNDSLIDGKNYSGNVSGDLYLIINKKLETGI
ncbi:MAG: lamin tail domain-containing protein [Minisyncoccota bacterium]